MAPQCPPYAAYIILANLQISPTLAYCAYITLCSIISQPRSSTKESPLIISQIINAIFPQAASLT